MKIKTGRTHLTSLFAIAACLSLASPVWAQATAAETPAPAAPSAPATPAAPATKNPWGHVSPDIVEDKSIVYGVLPNGMKYAIQKNETPKGGAAVRMHVDVGSIAEAENERGLAHFLEHMAFNGSKNVPEGEMVKILERQGLSFGADTNAYTSFDETVYKLDLPKTDETTVDTAMMLMREVGGNLTIAPEAVDRERGVVISEKQFRNSPQLRQYENLFQFGLPDAPFGKRFPIGTEEVLKTAPAARIRDFYQRYYRPENTTLVMVGDFDVKAIETKIKTKFSDWKGVGPAGVAMNVGKIDTARKLAVGTFSDPTITNSINVAITRPYVREDNSIATYQKSLIKTIASGIMNKRFDKLSQAADAKVVNGGIQFEDQFKLLSASLLSLTPKEGDWKNALMTGEQELRRALQFGFTQAEIDEQLANFETYFSDAAKQASTRRSNELADGILQTLDAKEIVSSPQTNLDIYQSIKSKLTLDAANGYFREAFGAIPNTIHVTTKTPIANPQAEVVTALQESSKIAVAAPVQAVNKAFAYNNYGKPGKIVQNKLIPDLGIRTIKFANNVRLNIKKTDFEKGTVRYGLRYGDGLLSVPQGKDGFGIFMSSMNALGGLKEHSFDELQRMMAGKQVGFGIGIGDDSFGTSGSTTATDLGLQMKMTAAYMTAGGYRPEADSIWQNNVQIFASQLDAQPQSVAGTQVPRLLANGDVRFGVGSAKELAARNVAEMKAILEPIASSAPIEIAIVGDIDEAAAIKAVAESFGALPKRNAANKTDPKAKMVSFPKDRKTVTLYHKGKEEQGYLQAFWPTTDDKDQKSAVTRSLTSDIMQLLLLDEVREKLGATYGPNAGSFASDLYPGYGYLSASVIAAPDKMGIISASIKKVTKEMRDAPVSPDLLLRARKPVLEAIEKSDRENGSWLGLTNVAQSQPAKLDRRRNQKALLESVTVADIQAAASQYLVDEAALEYRIVASTLNKSAEKAPMAAAEKPTP
jgi:zinc protease